MPQIWGPAGGGMWVQPLPLPPQHQNPWGLKGSSWGPDKAPSTTTFLECVLTCELEQLGPTAGCSGRRAAAEALCWLLLLSPAPAAIGLLPWALATGPSLSCSSGLMCMLLTILAGARAETDMAGGETEVQGRP